jgi:hypothetical protein
MRTISESNEHLEKGKSIWEQIAQRDEEESAFLEIRIAEVKAMQALALAILTLSDAIKSGE